MRLISSVIKRLLDITLSLIGLVLASPILLPVMFLVWKQDRHSPFYVAERMGKKEKPFKMVRTFYNENKFDNMSLKAFADSLGEGTANYEKYKIKDVSFLTDENVIVKFTFCEEKVCDVELVVK